MKSLFISILILMPFVSFSQSSLYHWYQVGDTSDTGPSIDVLYNDGKGHLYVGGSFNRIAGETINALAMWDGEQWHDLGFPDADYIHDIEELGDTLVVCGDFNFPQQDIGDIAMYYDGNWHPVGGDPFGFGASDGSISSLGIINNTLYAGGAFDEVYQPNGDALSVNNIARWSNGQWMALSEGGLEDEVNAMEVHDGKLYVGGAFSETYNGAVIFNYVAMYDPATQNWSALEDNGSGENGVDNYVESLMANDTALFVGGWFSEAGGKPAPYIARYTNGTWHGNYGAALDDPAQTMVIYKDQLYVGGSFQFDDPTGEEANDIAVLTDTNWYDLGTGLDYKAGGYVADMEVFDSSLYVIGNFEGGGGVESERIIKVVKRDTSSSTGILDRGFTNAYTLYPNPTSGSTHLTIETGNAGLASISIFNYLGQEIYSQPRLHLNPGKQTIPLHISTLPAGTYLVSILHNSRVRTLKMVIIDI